MQAAEVLRGVKIAGRMFSPGDRLLGDDLALIPRGNVQALVNLGTLRELSLVESAPAPTPAPAPAGRARK